MGEVPCLLEELRSDILTTVNDCADIDVIRLDCVEDEMRLEAEASITRCEFIDCLADQGEIGKKPKGADQSGIISFGLIRAEFALGEIVNVDQIGASPLSKRIVSHGGGQQRAAALRRGCRQVIRR